MSKLEFTFTTPSLDLSKKADLLRFCELRRNEMAARLLAKGRLVFGGGFSFMSWLFITRDPVTSKRLDKISVIDFEPSRALHLVPQLEQTRAYSDFIREMRDEIGLVGVLNVAEAWAGNYDEKTYEYGKLESNPEKMEIVYMYLETKTLTPLQWTAIVHRNPLRLEPWVENVYYSQGDERMANLL